MFQIHMDFEKTFKGQLHKTYKYDRTMNATH